MTHGRDTPLPVCAGDVDETQVALGVAELFEQVAHRLQAEFLTEETNAVEVFDGLGVRHAALNLRLPRPEK